MIRRVAFCLSPYHLAQSLALAEGEPIMILSPCAKEYAWLLSDFPSIEFRAIDQRGATLREMKRSGEQFDFYYATFWNRFALRMEKLAILSGGRVHLFEDGIGGFGRPWPDTYREIAVRFLCQTIDGTRPCAYILDKKLHERTTLYGALPETAPKGLTVKPIDFAPFRDMLPKVAPHFGHFDEYQKIPAFFDTNDCEGGWYPYEQKLTILKDILPSGPLLYFPHPNQRFNAAKHFSNLIDMTGLTHAWNEMACYCIRPPVIYSVFSTAAFALRHIYRIGFRSHLLFEEFYKRTGHPGFSANYVSPSMKAMLDHHEV